MSRSRWYERRKDRFGEQLAADFRARRDDWRSWAPMAIPNRRKRKPRDWRPLSADRFHARVAYYTALTVAARRAPHGTTPAYAPSPWAMPEDVEEPPTSASYEGVCRLDKMDSHVPLDKDP